MNDEHREEIRRSLARAQEEAKKQAERMRALDRGQPDPYSEMDQEFMDGAIREYLKGSPKGRGEHGPKGGGR